MCKRRCKQSNRPSTTTLGSPQQCTHYETIRSAATNCTRNLIIQFCSACFAAWQDFTLNLHHGFNSPHLSHTPSYILRLQQFLVAHVIDSYRCLTLHLTVSCSAWSSNAVHEMMETVNDVLQCMEKFDLCIQVLFTCWNGIWLQNGNHPIIYALSLHFVPFPTWFSNFNNIFQQHFM